MAVHNSITVIDSSSLSYFPFNNLINNQNYGREIFLRGITKDIGRTPY